MEIDVAGLSGEIRIVSWDSPIFFILLISAFSATMTSERSPRPLLDDNNIKNDPLH